MSRSSVLGMRVGCCRVSMTMHCVEQLRSAGTSDAHRGIHAVALNGQTKCVDTTIAVPRVQNELNAKGKW